MAVHGELSADPECEKIIIEALCAKQRPKVINALLAAAGKPSITKQGLYRWKQRPEVVAAEAQWSEHVLKSGLTQRHKRVLKLENLVKRMEQVMRGRAQEQTGFVEGGESGLLAKDVKSIGGGEFAEKVDIYRFDAAFVTAYNATLKAIAIEAGEYVEKREMSGKLEVTDGLTDEQRVDLHARIAAARAITHGNSD